MFGEGRAAAAVAGTGESSDQEMAGSDEPDFGEHMQVENNEEGNEESTNKMEGEEEAVSFLVSSCADSADKVFLFLCVASPFFFGGPLPSHLVSCTVLAPCLDCGGCSDGMRWKLRCGDAR